MLKEKIIIYSWLVVLTLVILGGTFGFISRIEKLEKSVPTVSPTGITIPGEEIAPPEKVLPGEEEWKEVAVFTGEGSQKTDSFFIPGKIWKMALELEREPQKSASLAFNIYRAENNELFNSTSGPIPFSPSPYYSEDFLYFGGEGSFYLDVTPTEIKSWKIKVYTAE